VAYYNNSELQPVHAADAWNLDRYLFTSLAYIARAGKKDGSDYDEDVLKALWFLAYAITKNAEYADTVISVCKNLKAGAPYEEQPKADTSIKLSSYVGTTPNTGDVSEYRKLRGEEESKLVREKSTRALYGPSEDYSG
jgi:hypothetical protein